MNLRQCILTENVCYKKGEKIEPVGIVVHSTGANNPYLCRYVQPDDGLLGRNAYNNHWNMDVPSLRVCVHAFIGRLKDGSIAAYQTLPWDHRPWGCASGPNGSYNNSHIQFEICEDGLSDRAYFSAVYREAVELCAYLCLTRDISPENICDHSEAHRRGYASNHADVRHWLPRHGKSMDIFRADVRKELEELSYEKWKEYFERYMEELAAKEPDAWSREDREIAEKIGLVKGDGKSMRYKSFCTREEMAVFLVRAIRYVLGRGEGVMIIHSATGTGGGINESISFILHGKLHEIRLHLSGAGGGGDLTVTIDSAGGAAYDTVILKQDMTEVQDLHFRPNRPIHIEAGSALKVAWANSENKTYGLEVLYEMGCGR
jgi:N-acetylmuramoyl-L-alanine amidase